MVQIVESTYSVVLNLNKLYVRTLICVTDKLTCISYYSHPDDIDLYAGGLSERHIQGAAMGPTFACIVARHFREMKVGDRFWYENEFHETGFTQGLLRF